MDLQFRPIGRVVSVVQFSVEFKIEEKVHHSALPTAVELVKLAILMIK